MRRTNNYTNYDDLNDKEWKLRGDLVFCFASELGRTKAILLESDKYFGKEICPLEEVDARFEIPEECPYQLEHLLDS